MTMALRLSRSTFIKSALFRAMLGGGPASMRILELEPADVVSTKHDKPCFAVRSGSLRESSARTVSFTRSIQAILCMSIRRTSTDLSTGKPHHHSELTRCDTSAYNYFYK